MRAAARGKRSPEASGDSSASSGSGDSATTTTSSSSSSEPKRARKSTYVMRKEEAAQLELEAAALEARLRQLEERSRDHDQLLVEKVMANALLREARRRQQLSVAEAQSAVSGFLNAERTNPLHSTIRLGKDWDERRTTLVGLRAQKLRDTFEYMTSRVKFLDPLKPHRSEECFETESGDYCCARFDLVQLEGVTSVRQVYDVLLSYLQNIEITVTEHMDQLTLREDYDAVGSSATNFRLLTARTGVTIESNLVAFAEYYESHDLSAGAPCAVLVLDFVDEDELYPYNPNKRVRKDVSKALVLTPHMRKKPGKGEEELVVVMGQAKFLKLCKPKFEVSPGVLRGIRETMSWTSVMLTTLSEKL